MGKNDVGDDLEKYVKYSTDELLTLRDSYRARINTKMERHWLTKIEQKYHRSLRKMVSDAGMVMLFFGAGIMALMMIFTIVTPQDANAYSNGLKWMLVGAIPMFLSAFILQSLDDGSRNLRVELRNIELVLDNKTSPDKKIMLDSNITNDLHSGKITRRNVDTAKEKGYKFYIITVQSDEIASIGDEEKRKRLELCLHTFSPQVIDAETTIDALSQKKFSKNEDIVKKIVENKSNPKKEKDALIAQASIKHGLTLLTNDERLRVDVIKFGGKTLTINEFKNKIES